MFPSRDKLALIFFRPLKVLWVFILYTFDAARKTRQMLHKPRLKPE